MNISIENETEYKELIFHCITCFNVYELNAIIDDLYKSIKDSKDTKLFIRTMRLITLIKAYIKIIELDLSKLN
jgi:hypothetical protein